MGIRMVTGLVLNLGVLTAVIAGVSLAKVHPALMLAPVLLLVLGMYALLRCPTCRALTWVWGSTGH